MNSLERPSRREIDKRIVDAKRALSGDKCYFTNPVKNLNELNKLEIGDSSEVWVLLIELVEEIEIEHYAGSHPPMKSYEPTINGCELYAFMWKSKKMGKEMYLKFSVKNECFYLVSLHVSTPIKKGEEL